MLAEVNGMIADFAPANCQEDNPDLWVALVNHPMMINCLCLDPVTGEVEKEEHDCSVPCDSSGSPGTWWWLQVVLFFKKYFS